MNADILAKLQEEWREAPQKVFSSTSPAAPLPPLRTELEGEPQPECPHPSYERLLLLATSREFFICRACKLGWYGEKL